MKIRFNLAIACAIFLIALTLPLAWCQKMGIATKFVRVSVEGVPVGKIVRIVEFGKPRYSVKNQGDAPVTVFIQTDSPTPDSLKSKYLPIPDASWVRIEPNRLVIPPSETRSADVVIEFPADLTHSGKKYHAKITATIVDSPALVSAAVSSDLLIHTLSKKEQKRIR